MNNGSDNNEPLIDAESAVYDDDGNIIGQYDEESDEVIYLEGKGPGQKDPPKPEEKPEGEDGKKPEGEENPEEKKEKKPEEEKEEKQDPEFVNHADYILKAGGYDLDEVEFENGEKVKIADLSPEQQLNIMLNEFNRMQEEFQSQIDESSQGNRQLNGDQKALVEFLDNGGTARELAQYILDNDPENAHKGLTDDDLVLESIRKSMPDASEEDVQEEYKILKEAGRVEKRAVHLRKQLSSGEIKLSDISETYRQKSEAQREIDLKEEREQAAKLSQVATSTKEVAGIPIDPSISKTILKDLIPEKEGEDSNFLKSLNSPEKLIRLQFLDKYAEKVFEHISKSAMQEGVELERARLQDEINNLRSQLNLKNQHLQKFKSEPIINFKSSSKKAPTEPAEEVF